MCNFVSVELKVRDYECDMQGIVNNANYLHYLECARHEYMESIGLDFAELTEKGIILVVKRIEIDYIAPLKSNDVFNVTCSNTRISPLRFGFNQEIIRKSDNKKIVSALVVATAINKQGRPFLPKEIEDAF